MARDIEFDPADRAIIGSGEGLRALADALGVYTKLRRYGAEVVVIGEYTFSSGPGNGWYWFTARPGAEFEWHYRLGWQGRQPIAADFDL